MNKYQKALSDIVDNGVTIDYFNEKAKLPQSENPIFTIHELVDRATPAIPLRGLTLSAGWNIKVICRCGNILGRKNHFCSNCGKAIDWGVDND